MRIDKYLKIARVIKRRTVANTACSAGRVKINSRTAKPSTPVNVGDIVEISFGSGLTKFEIKSVKENVKKEEAPFMYRIIEDTPENTEDT